MPGERGASSLVDEIMDRARDAAYVAVGFGILSFQRAQRRRRDLARRAGAFDDPVGRVSGGMASGAQQLGEWLESTAALVDSQLRPLEAQLPEPARELVSKARTQVEAWGAQLLGTWAPGA